jgi:extracellular elastinolytic metalloproteinase
MNRSRGVAVASMACGLFWTSLTTAQEIAPTQDAERHFDARLDLNRGFVASRSAVAIQPQAIQGLTANVEELTVESNDATGAVSTLSSQRGYLTGATSGRPMDLAMAFVRSNVAALGLEPSDLQGYAVSDVVHSRVTGATHIYLQQRHAGIPVYNAQLQINVNRDGRIISVNNSFLPALAQSATALKPRMQLAAAVTAAAKFSGIAVPAQLRALESTAGPQQVTRMSHAGLSLAPINGRLMLLPIRRGEARLVWNFQIHTLDEQHTWDFTVDADTGQVWTRFDGTVSDQYRVYARPVESPTHTTPLPPADGRTLAVNPANSTASPFGWHDTNAAAGAEFTTTQGNNVEAYTDTDNNNAPDAGSSPSGGAALNFDFPINLAGAPSTYRPAAVTNLFYWNNIIHDVQYQYGFDEAAGNFQVNN